MNAAEKKREEFIDLVLSLTPAETIAMLAYYRALLSGEPEESARSIGLEVFNKARKGAE